MGFEVYDELSYLRRQQEQTERNLKAVAKYLQETGVLPEGIVTLKKTGVLRASEDGGHRKNKG